MRIAVCIPIWKRYELTEKGNGVVDYFDGAKQLINVDDIVSPN